MRFKLHNLWLIFALAHAACLLFSGQLWAAADECAVCGRPITNAVYLVTDKVTAEKQQVCSDCLMLRAHCFLGGLPQSAFKATCAHELGHVWLNENLSTERKQRINRDAIEGFCELLSYLLMDSQHEEAQLKQIKLNAYTRGQIHLFIETERRYG